MKKSASNSFNRKLAWAKLNNKSQVRRQEVKMSLVSLSCNIGLIGSDEIVIVPINGSTSFFGARLLFQLTLLSASLIDLLLSLVVFASHFIGYKFDLFLLVFFKQLLLLNYSHLDLAIFYLLLFFYRVDFRLKVVPQS